MNFNELNICPNDLKSKYLSLFFFNSILFSSSGSLTLHNVSVFSKLFILLEKTKNTNKGFEYSVLHVWTDIHSSVTIIERTGKREIGIN